MKKQNVWISYDLGIKGDYPGLYKWLDEHKAKECGNNLAYFAYEHTSTSDFITELTTDFKENIEFKNGDRIYAVFRKKEGAKFKRAGKFIIGNRKASPWEGYAPIDENVLDFDIDE